MSEIKDSIYRNTSMTQVGLFFVLIVSFIYAKPIFEEYVGIDISAFFIGGFFVLILLKSNKKLDKFWQKSGEN